MDEKDFRDEVRRRLGSSKQLVKILNYYFELLDGGGSHYIDEPGLFSFLTEGAAFSSADAKARNANNRLREMLEDLSQTRFGRKASTVLSVPPTRYGLSKQAANDAHTKRFWAPFIDARNDEQHAAHVVYTEHLFSFNRERKYLLRHLSANDPTQDIREHLEFVPQDHGTLEATRQFVNSSEVAALLEVSRWFGGLFVPVEFTRSQVSEARDRCRSRSTLVFGNSRSLLKIEG